MEKIYVTNAELPQADYLSIAQIAARLATSKMTVYRMCQRGELPSIRVGRSYRVPVVAYELRYGTDAVRVPGPAPVIPGQLKSFELNLTAPLVSTD